MKKIIAIAALLFPITGMAQTVTGAIMHQTRDKDARVVATVSAPTNDAIIGGSSPVADMVKPMTVARDGHMPPAAIPLAAGKPRLLSVHGYHLMLMGLKRPLVAGDTVPVVVRFQSGATVMTTVAVK